MIQGFIQDSAIWRKINSPVVEESLIDQGVGYFNSKVKDKFVKPVCINDSRTSRLNILAFPLKGDMKLWFDKEHIDVADPVNNLTSDQWNFIMSIVEYVTYSTALSIEELEDYLVNNPLIFGTYRPNSLSISANVSADVVCQLNNGTEFETEIRRSLMFSYTNGATFATIKVWITSNTFQLEYPLYKITKIVLPCSPNMLINPAMANTIPTVIGAATYAQPIIDKQVTSIDNTGTYTFKTRYVNANLTDYYDMPFLIFYTGHEPSSLAIRVAVREYLESIPDYDPAIWTTLFPDLYTDTRVYILPVWGNVTVLPERDLYPSITRYRNIVPLVQSIFPGLQPDYINNNMTLLTCDASSVQLIAIPDPNNVVVEDLLVTHPTYTNVDSTNTNFSLQTIPTREFNIKLCNAISYIMGGTPAANTFIVLTEDNKQYVTFISNLIEYCVLHINSYPF